MKSKIEKYKFLEHTADVKFQAYGKSIEEVFLNSALALQEVMTRGVKIKAKMQRKIFASGKDNESVLYNFLEEFLFLLDSEGFIFSEINEIKIDGNKVVAEISGDKAKNYKFTNDVKAITYNQMFVKKEKDGWVAQVVVDV